LFGFIEVRLHLPIGHGDQTIADRTPAQNLRIAARIDKPRTRFRDLNTESFGLSTIVSRNSAHSILIHVNDMILRPSVFGELSNSAEEPLDLDMSLDLSINEKR
jgi:hypothetical protein